MENHKEMLKSLCRVCSKKLGRVSYSLKKQSNQYLIEQCFHVDVSNDDERVHPSRFCNSCYSAMKRMVQVDTVHSSLTIHTWMTHQDGTCETCDMIEARKKGGRPKSKKNVAGCPSYLSKHICTVAGPRYGCSSPLNPKRFLTESLSLEDLTCHHCNNIVDEPVELPCKHIVCRPCCFHLLNSDPFSCPECNQIHQVAVSSIQSPTPLIDKLLRRLLVHCDRERCKKIVHLCDLKTHLDSGCTEAITSVPHSLTIDHILQQPTTAPPTNIEIETAGHVVRKIMSQSPDTSFSLPTGGHVCMYVCVGIVSCTVHIE